MADRYDIGRRLGGGSFGDVFEAKDSVSGRRVAVKRVFRRAAERGVLRPDPGREVRVLREVNHPNVVKLLDDFEDEGGCQMLVFPLLTGGTLSDVVRAVGGGLGEATAKGFLRQLLAGLAYLHGDARVVHRDVKSANLLLGHGGALRIADFGQARWVRDTTVAADAPGPGAGARGAGEGPGDGESGLLTPHTGTRWLRAPEQLFGSRRYGPAVDVWAAGCVAAELLVGAEPFRGEADITQIACIAERLGFPSKDGWPELEGLPDGGKLLFAPRPAPPPRSWLPRCSPDAVDFVTSCLRWRASERPGAGELLSHRWLASAPPRPLSPPLLPTVRGRALVVAAGAAKEGGVSVPGAWEVAERGTLQDARAASDRAQAAAASGLRRLPSHPPRRPAARSQRGGGAATSAWAASGSRPLPRVRPLREVEEEDGGGEPAEEGSEEEGEGAASAGCATVTLEHETPGRLFRVDWGDAEEAGSEAAWSAWLAPPGAVAAASLGWEV